MIVGTGIDIVEIERFQKAIERNPDLIKRVFTQMEIDYCSSKNKPHIHYALRFAAKEAVAKSLGVGIRNFKWTDIEVTKLSSGKPEARLHNGAKKISDGLKVSTIDISLSFSRNNAIASSIALNGNSRIKDENNPPNNIDA